MGEEEDDCGARLADAAISEEIVIFGIVDSTRLGTRFFDLNLACDWILVGLF